MYDLNAQVQKIFWQGLVHSFLLFVSSCVFLSFTHFLLLLLLWVLREFIFYTKSYNAASKEESSISVAQCDCSSMMHLFPVFLVWYFISLRPSIFEIYILLHDIFKANNVLLISWVTTSKWCWDLNLCLSLDTRMFAHAPNVTFLNIITLDTLILYIRYFCSVNWVFLLMYVNVQ